MRALPRALLASAAGALLVLLASGSQQPLGAGSADARPRSGDTLRVWFGSPAPAAPHRTWETAFRTIQEAIDAADSGDCVLIRADTAAVYSGPQMRCHERCDRPEKVAVPSVVFMKAGVAVRGEEGGPLPILCGFDSTRTVTWIDGSRRAVLERVRLRSGGALFAGSIDSTNAIRRCVFEACRAREGGAALLRGEAAPVIETNLFVGNGDAESGGGFHGGAISILGSVPPRRATIRDNIFRGNGTGGMGGAIRVQGGTGSIERNLFEGNHAGMDGGAIAIDGGRPLVSGNVFRANAAVGHGGALGIGRNSGFRNLKILWNVFDGDSAAAGGGLAIEHGGDNPAEMLVANNTFFACRAESSGAALHVGGPALDRHRLYINRNLFASGGKSRTELLGCNASGVGAPIDSMVCNLFWSGKPESVPAIACAQGVAVANFSNDPQFVAGDTLHAVGPDSPCAPARSRCGGVGSGGRP